MDDERKEDIRWQEREEPIDEDKLYRQHESIDAFKPALAKFIEQYCNENELDGYSPDALADCVDIMADSFTEMHSELIKYINRSI